MHSKDIYWLDKNFRDFFQNDMIFGGVPALFEGDNGQISSALAITVRESRLSNGHPIPANTPNYDSHKI